LAQIRDPEEIKLDKKKMPLRKSKADRPNERINKWINAGRRRDSDVLRMAYLIHDIVAGIGGGFPRGGA
jgi:hypothetical protein